MTDINIGTCSPWRCVRQERRYHREVAEVTLDALDEALGLRERKKLRTRASLVQAAVDLCVRQGYERTTVEQIAAAAEVSTRTFSRYFATKDAVVLAFVDDVVDSIAAELRRQPEDLSHLEAIYRAHLDMYHRTERALPGDLTSERLLTMVRIIMTSPHLRQTVTEYEAEASDAALADRMGLDVDDRRVRLVGATWGSIIMTALSELMPTTEWTELTIEAIVAQIKQTYAEFVELIVEIPQPA